MDEHMTAYKTMVALLALDEDTAERLNRCISDPRAYYKDHAGSYAERSVPSDADDDTIIWIGMVDILIEQGIMFEFDWKAEREDFVYGMQEIIPDGALSIDEDCLEEEADITEWLKVLCREWSGQGFVTAGMDIDSDSYCVLIIAENVFHRLVEEAGRTGHRIALAQDL